MEAEFTTLQLSRGQADFFALCQKNYQKIQYHIEKRLWEKQDNGKWLGSYTVNMKPDTGEIDNAIGYKHYGA